MVGDSGSKMNLEIMMAMASGEKSKSKTTKNMSNLRQGGGGGGNPTVANDATTNYQSAKHGKATLSSNYLHTSENFEGMAAKKVSKNISGDLNSIDLNMEATASQENKSTLEYGYQKVDKEKKPLDHMLDHLENVCTRVMESHIDRLAWKFKPKLSLAQEKVQKLEQIVKAKEKARE